jgi:hypothetical protein
MKVKSNVKAGQSVTLSAFAATYQAQAQEQAATAAASIVIEA